MRRADAVLDGLMRSDEDMAALYLSHQAATGAARAVSDHAEVEMLLEGVATQLMDLSDRIVALQSSVKVHPRLIEWLVDWLVD